MEEHKTSTMPVLPPRRPKSENELKRDFAWQKSLLAWFIILPSVLIAGFMILATLQVNRFSAEVYKDDASIIEELTNRSPYDSIGSPETRLDYLRWVTLARLEERSLDKRHGQAGLMLMSRIFTKYLGFLTGMILAIVGAVFIIGKLSEDTTQLSGDAGASMRINLVSSSPGIIFGTLGTVLMLFTTVVHNDVTVEDTPLYLTPRGILSSSIVTIPDDTIDVGTTFDTPLDPK